MEGLDWVDSSPGCRNPIEQDWRRTNLLCIGAGPKSIAVAARWVAAIDVCLQILGCATNASSQDVASYEEHDEDELKSFAHAAFLRLPNLTIVDKHGVGSSWSSEICAGYTDGEGYLCSPVEQDVGFPYDPRFEFEEKVINYPDSPMLPIWQDFLKDIDCEFAGTQDQISLSLIDYLNTSGLAERISRRVRVRFSWQAYLESQKLISKHVISKLGPTTHKEFEKYLQWVHRTTTKTHEDLKKTVDLLIDRLSDSALKKRCGLNKKLIRLPEIENSCELDNCVKFHKATLTKGNNGELLWRSDLSKNLKKKQDGSFKGDNFHKFFDSILFTGPGPSSDNIPIVFNHYIQSENIKKIKQSNAIGLFDGMSFWRADIKDWIKVRLMMWNDPVTTFELEKKVKDLQSNSQRGDLEEIPLHANDESWRYASDEYVKNFFAKKAVLSGNKPNKKLKLKVAIIGGGGTAASIAGKLLKEFRSHELDFSFTHFCEKGLFVPRSDYFVERRYFSNPAAYQALNSAHRKQILDHTEASAISSQLKDDLDIHSDHYEPVMGTVLSVQINRASSNEIDQSLPIDAVIAEPNPELNVNRLRPRLDVHFYYTDSSGKRSFEKLIDFDIVVLATGFDSLHKLGKVSSAVGASELISLLGKEVESGKQFSEQIFKDIERANVSGLVERLETYFSNEGLESIEGKAFTELDTEVNVHLDLGNERRKALNEFKNKVRFDLSLPFDSKPAFGEFVPQLYAPFLAADSQGPGLMNLGCLESVASRILKV